MFKLFNEKKRWNKAQKNEKEYWVDLMDKEPNLEDSSWYTHVLNYFDIPVGNDFEDEVIVDIGAGPVCILNKLKSKRKIAVDPIDINSKDKTIERIKATGENTSLKRDVASRVFLYNVLQHVISPQKVLDEIVRVSAKDSYIYILENLNQPTDICHPHRLTLELFEKWMKKNKFEVIKKTHTLDHILTSVNPERPGSGYSVLCLILKNKKEDYVNPITKMYKKILKTKPQSLLTHGGIELTNICNLACKDCPTPTSKVEKGFATEKNVKLALKYSKPGQNFSFHRLGEPLLHPRLIEYVKLASKAGLKPIISTNGLLLTQEIFNKLVNAGVKLIHVSLHTKKSVEAYKMVADYLIENNIEESNLSLSGNLLSNNVNADRWLDELNVSEESRKYIRRIGTHNWAGNVDGTKELFSSDLRQKRMANCCYLNSNYCSVRWDGTVVSCCFDSENDNILGHIKDYPKLKHLPEQYKLCSYCDPNWANGEML